MILNKGPPSEFETNNKILNSGGTDMYIEHPYFYEGKYYANIDGEGFMIEDFPDLNCDVEHCVLTKMEQQDIHKVINQLNSEERMIIYGIFFENKPQTQMAEIMGISRQMLSYKLKSTLNKMREMYMNKFFKKFFKIFCICQSHLTLVIRGS